MLKRILYGLGCLSMTMGLGLVGCATVRPAAPGEPAVTPVGGAAVADANLADRIELHCEAGYGIVASRTNSAEVTFKQDKQDFVAKQNAMEVCHHNEGKFLCYKVNADTMINLPIDLASRHSGEKVKLEVNDDAGDTPGNGKGFECTVN